MNEVAFVYQKAHEENLNSNYKHLKARHFFYDNHFSKLMYYHIMQNIKLLSA